MGALLVDWFKAMTAGPQPEPSGVFFILFVVMPLRPALNEAVTAPASRLNPRVRSIWRQAEQRSILMGKKPTPQRFPTLPISKGSKRKAAEMAGREIDQLGDQTATREERARRKRRLIKGPREFRDIRKNKS